MNFKILEKIIKLVKGKKDKIIKGWKDDEINENNEINNLCKKILT